MAKSKPPAPPQPDQCTCPVCSGKSPYCELLCLTKAFIALGVGEDHAASVAADFVKCVFCHPVPSSIKIVEGENMGVKVRGFRKAGTKRAGAPISLNELVAKNGALLIEVDDQKGNAMTVDPTTISGGSMSSDNAGAVVTQPTPTDFLDYTLTVDPTLASSGTVVNLVALLSFTTDPPGTLPDTEEVICDLTPPVSVPTTIRIKIGS